VAAGSYEGESVDKATTAALDELIHDFFRGEIIPELCHWSMSLEVVS
jgi:hypothetical protein